MNKSQTLSYIEKLATELLNSEITEEEAIKEMVMLPHDILRNMYWGLDKEVEDIISNGDEKSETMWDLLEQANDYI